MKVILIVTRQSDELQQLGIGEFSKIHVFTEGLKQIIGVKGGTGESIQDRYRTDVIPVLIQLTGDIIILYHNSAYELLRDTILENERLTLVTEVNCASIENNREVSASDRKCYDELRANKWGKFDAAWKHFSQIDPHEVALRQLHNILNGTQKFNITGEKEPIFYNNEKETHRVALSKLRDELLTPL